MVRKSRYQDRIRDFSSFDVKPFRLKIVFVCHGISALGPGKDKNGWLVSDRLEFGVTVIIWSEYNRSEWSLGFCGHIWLTTS